MYQYVHDVLLPFIPKLTRSFSTQQQQKVEHNTDSFAGLNKLIFKALDIEICSYIIIQVHRVGPFTSTHRPQKTTVSP